MKKHLAAAYLMLLMLAGHTQQPQGLTGYCFTDQLWQRTAQQNPGLKQRRALMDSLISIKANNQKLPVYKDQKSLNSTPTTVVPLVIYIVYDDPSVNISMQQIQSQVDKLNADFASYGFAFCYAKRNVLDTTFFTHQPGDSSGVFRINSSTSNVDAYNSDGQLKALSQLPAANYLRIFVVHSIVPQGILGYAQLPGGLPATDGIVMRYDVFGNDSLCPTCLLLQGYDQGKSLTHEVGHFFDLYHTFQGGCYTGTGTAACQIFGDQVCDTPPCDGIFGCPSHAPLSCDGVTPELIDNYMDYTDDPCKNSFTPGQVARMQFATQGYHQTLVSTANLINTGVSCTDLGDQYAGFY